MKRIFTFIFLLTFILPAIPARAALIGPGELIKASMPAVYYFYDGKRYVFPNESIYFSWYDDFDNIKDVSDETLASIPIGGNVTYRPGKFLVKITTDPKVYAVADNNELRWVATEEIAKSLYGDEWAKEVRDVSDVYFLNYRITNSIDEAAQYDPAQFRLSYARYSKVLAGLLDQAQTPSIAEFAHPTPLYGIEAQANGYTATTTLSIQALRDWFVSQATGWTNEYEYNFSDATSTGLLMNFQKIENGETSHRSIAVYSEGDQQYREIMFHEMTYPEGYMAYPYGATFEYVYGNTDVAQGIVTNHTEADVALWYQQNYTGENWSLPEKIEDPFGLASLYRQYNEPNERMLVYTYMKMDLFTGIHLFAVQYAKGIPEMAE